MSFCVWTVKGLRKYSKYEEKKKEHANKQANIGLKKPLFEAWDNVGGVLIHHTNMRYNKTLVQDELS